eukprot:3934370-Rhodomonas_salina.1
MSEGVSPAEPSEGGGEVSLYAGAVLGGTRLTSFGSVLRCLSECMVGLRGVCRLESSTDSVGNRTRASTVQD